MVRARALLDPISSWELSRLAFVPDFDSTRGGRRVGVSGEDAGRVRGAATATLAQRRRNLGRACLPAERLLWPRRERSLLLCEDEGADGSLSVRATGGCSVHHAVTRGGNLSGAARF